jgi:hypothetical protein
MTANKVVDEINALRTENKKLRIACRLIHQRGQHKSGSLEMKQVDEYCKGIGLRVWEWPLGDFWDYEES